MSSMPILTDHSAEHQVSLPPRLVLEILSPSTWRRDLGAKREAYAAGGVQDYWVIAPETPSVTCYRLDGQVYREEVHLGGEHTWMARPPFQVALSPARLVA